jgi:ABC-2 type transport system ATP-binding protein
VLTGYKGRDPFDNLSKEQLDRLGLTTAVSPNGGERR